MGLHRLGICGNIYKYISKYDACRFIDAAILHWIDGYIYKQALCCSLLGAYACSYVYTSCIHILRIELEFGYVSCESSCACLRALAGCSFVHRTSTVRTSGTVSHFVTRATRVVLEICVDAPV